MPIEKVQLSIFDVFGFVVPGTGILLAIWIIIDSSLTSLESLVALLMQITLTGMLVSGVVAYVVGFIINNLGYELHQQVGLRIWQISEKLWIEGQANSQKNVLVREFSPANHVYLEKWLSYRAFSHNLAFAFLVLGICMAIKFLVLLPSTMWEWLLLSVATLGSIFPLLYRAQLYQKLYFLDLNNILKELRLEQKAIKAVETKEKS